MPREHKRPKTDRLDPEMLMRALLGWLRGEPRHCRHCRMAQIPTLEEEDAKRPSREHKRLVHGQTSLVNSMKSTLVRLGTTDFNIKLVKAGQKLAGLRTPNGEPIPPDTLAGLYRGLERLALIRRQIKAIEQEREQRLCPSSARGGHGGTCMVPLQRRLGRLAHLTGPGPNPS